MSNIDEYTLTSISLRMKSGPNVIGQASGFFYRKRDRLFLVSNWHVFSGRNTYTGQPIHSSGAIPDRAEFALCPTKHIGKFLDIFSLPILDKNGEPLWIQHKLGQDVDVAMIEFFMHSKLFLINSLPFSNETRDLAFRVGMDAFILGFPKNISQQEHLPIWKRASIATEPEISYQDLPVFLVDSASREGMSGSPVILRSNGGYISTNGASMLGPGQNSLFIGVYSGRFGANDEMSAQLGRVWHRSVIDEIIAEKNPGQFELRP